MSIRSEATKNKIINEAVDLFNEYGFARTSIRQLAAKLEMASSIIYFHFINKEDILFNIIKSAGDKVLFVLNEVVKEKNDPLDCIRGMISNLLCLFGDVRLRKEIAIFLAELNQLPEDFKEICKKQHREILNIFRDKIGEIEKAYKIKPINHTAASFGIFGAMLWNFRWFRDDGELSIEEMTNELLRLVLDGLMHHDCSLIEKGTDRNG